MYQVIKMYGDWEPWWFIDGWQDDIIDEQQFSDWQEALDYFNQEWQRMKAIFPSYHSQKNLLATFGKKKIKDGARTVTKIYSSFILFYSLKIKILYQAIIISLNLNNEMIHHR